MSDILSNELSLSHFLSGEQDISCLPTVQVESFIETLEKPGLHELIDYLSTKISSDKENIFYSSFYFYRGLCYRLLLLPDNSLSDYNEAINLDPYNDRYFYNRAELSFFLLGDSNVAEKISALFDCGKAIEFRVNTNIDYFLLRASILADLATNSLKGINQDSNFNSILYRAIEDLNFVIKLYPDSIEAYTLRLSCFYSTKEYYTCINDCESALKLLNIKDDWFKEKDSDTSISYYIHTLYWYWNALTQINDLPKANLFKYLYIDTLANQELYFANQYLYNERFEESIKCLELALDYLNDCGDLYSSESIEPSDKFNSLLETFESKRNLVLEKISVLKDFN